MAQPKKPMQSAAVASDKEKALATALANIEKQFGKGAIMRLGENVTMNVDKISTGSLSLDVALGIGGVPRGRVVEIYGPESSGKTTIALHIAAEAQKKGGYLVFEYGFDQQIAVRNILLQTGYNIIEEIVDLGGNARGVVAQKQ